MDTDRVFTSRTKDGPSVAAVLLNYYGPALTLRCVQSLLESTRVPDRIIVVDNGSETPHDLDVLRAHALVEIVTPHVNLGFAGGNNLGITRALDMGAEYVWILNNDTTVHPECLYTLLLVSPATRERALLTNQIRYPDGRTWYAGGIYDRSRGTALHRQVPDERDAHPRPTRYAVGCSIFASREVLAALGGFDDSLFLYCEDADLSERAREHAVPIIYVPGALVYHDEGGSTSKGSGAGTSVRPFFKARNRMILARRWGTVTATLLATPRWAAAELRNEFRAGMRHGIKGSFALAHGLTVGSLGALPAPAPASFTLAGAPLDDGQPQPVVRVAALWHGTTSGNLGVNALSLCSTALIRDAASMSGHVAYIHEIRTTDVDSDQSHTRFDAQLTLEVSARPDKFLHNLLTARRVLGEYDLIVDLSEGDSFSDIYGLKRLTWQTCLKLAAATSRAPYVLAPQTIGPFNTALGRVQARLVLRRTALVGCRDDVSAHVSRSLAPRSDVAVTPDLAFSLAADTSTGQFAGSTALVGVNVSGLLYAATSESRYFVPGYAEFVHLLLRTLCTAGVQVVLVPHVFGDETTGDDDRLISLQLSEEYGVPMAPRFATPSEAKGFIGQLDFLVAARMHATIAAASTGVPFCATAYSRKFIDTLGLVGAGTVVELSLMPPADGVAQVMRAFEKRDQQRGGLASAQAQATEGHRQWAERLSLLMPGSTVPS